MKDAGGLLATTPATFVQDTGDDTGRARLEVPGAVACGGRGRRWAAWGGRAPVLACQTTENASELRASRMTGEASFLLLQMWELLKGGAFFFWDAPVFTCDLCEVSQARSRSHFTPQTYFLSRQALLTVEAGGTLD